MKKFVENEETFNKYISLAEKVYHRVSSATSCDKDYVDDSLYPELSIATLVYHHFCDRFVKCEETPAQYLSMQSLVDFYDREPEYAFAYMKQFEALLNKFHVVNMTPIDDYYDRAFFLRPALSPFTKSSASSPLV